MSQADRDSSRVLDVKAVRSVTSKLVSVVTWFFKSRFRPNLNLNLNLKPTRVLSFRTPLNQRIHPLPLALITKMPPKKGMGASPTSTAPSTAAAAPPPPAAAAAVAQNAPFLRIVSPYLCLTCTRRVVPRETVGAERRLPQNLSQFSKALGSYTGQYNTLIV
jgi:hypothetical protein